MTCTMEMLLMSTDSAVRIDGSAPTPDIIRELVIYGSSMFSGNRPSLRDVKEEEAAGDGPPMTSQPSYSPTGWVWTEYNSES
ncbi:unnamed protein product [Symbiodinium natans]|uniref:Uncharacterized protein n=1 Tax=Symbiodinium natans TaxID=878477 RepID=A0A812RAM3_9DINO|nr:unnamed protein product [Symbiodinium natans]